MHLEILELKPRKVSQNALGSAKFSTIAAKSVKSALGNPKPQTIKSDF